MRLHLTVGRRIVNAVTYCVGYGELCWYAIRHIILLQKGAIRFVLYRQIYFTGIEAVDKIGVIGALIGMIVITQVTNLVGLNALLAGKILIWIVVRELGPLLVAIIIIARSATAVATELGSMKVSREVEWLRIMGIDPVNYLLVPRIIGMTLSVFILTFYFQAAAIAGGLAFASVFIELPFFQHLRGIFAAVSFFEVWFSLVKGLVFGLLISTVSCYQGFSVRSSITEIPQAAIRAVMQSLFFVFIADGLISLVVLL